MVCAGMWGMKCFKHFTNANFFNNCIIKKVRTIIIGYLFSVIQVIISHVQYIKLATMYKYIHILFNLSFEIKQWVIIVLSSVVLN